LAAARAITDEWERAQALQALAPHLPANLLAEALTAARLLTAERERAQTLQALALHLAHTITTIAAYPISPWHTTMRVLAARGRPAFLRDLVALMPWLTAHASSEELKEIFVAIRDVARCWP
jgi:hypothetical protein